MAPERDRRRSMPAAVATAVVLAAAVVVAILWTSRSEVPVASEPEVRAAVPGSPAPPPTLGVSPRARPSEATRHEPTAADGGRPPAPADGDPAGQEFAAIRADIEARRWASGRDRFEAFAQAHPDADEATRKALDALKEEYARRRRGHLAEIAGSRVPEILRPQIEARITRLDETWELVSGWLRRECVEECLAAVLDELRGADPAVSPEEVTSFWDSRLRSDSSWRLCRLSNLQSRPVTGAATSHTVAREAWWAKASVDQRTDECFSVFVQKSGLFDVEAVDEQVPCERCGGSGKLPAPAHGGASTVPCPVCAGAGRIAEPRLRYR